MLKAFKVYKVARFPIYILVVLLAIIKVVYHVNIPIWAIWIPVVVLSVFVISLAIMSKKY